jgi:protein ImuB
VDAAAFAGRSLASALHRSLESAGVGCTRLAIHAVTANGEELNRVWRCAEPLTEDATADRVRWQLDGWLNRRHPSDRPTTPITVLRLHPVEVVSAEALQLPPWGSPSEDDRLRARRALVWVQGLPGRSGRCRCSAVAVGQPSALRSRRWATSRCRGPT